MLENYLTDSNGKEPEASPDLDRIARSSMDGRLEQPAICALAGFDGID